MLSGLRLLLGLAGAFFVAVIISCFTAWPWKVLTWLGNDPSPLAGSPNYIVLLSGGGIPSESGLMRSYQAASLAHTYPGATLIVAMPEEADEATSSTRRMFEELEMRGVARARLLLEGKGRNTREQAANIRTMVGATNQPALLVVTSPDHMKRSLLTFRKLGFTRVHGAAAYDVAVNADLRFDVDTLGLSTTPTPGVGSNLVVRYQFWNNLMMEARIVREFFALAYYKMNGWI
jgi:uncharacterized SAM-binding protein YcdF (DUF218 family)